MEHTFVGRSNELRSLHELWDSEKYKIFGIYGLKSVGKTRFVREFTKELAKHDQGIEVVTFDFSQINTFGRFLKVFCEAFDVEPPSNGKGVCNDSKDEAENEDEENNSIDKMIKEIDGRVGKGGRLLFVLSNLENVMPKASRDGSDPDSMKDSLWDIIWDRVFKHIICHDRPTYLFIDSTRYAKFALNGKAFIPIDLHPLDEVSSAELLREVTNHAVNIDGDGVMQAIANLCFGLPMAIVNAGGKLNEGLLEPEELIYLLTKSTLAVVSDEFLASSQRQDKNFNRDVSRFSTEDRKKLRSLAFACEENEKHNDEANMNVRQLTELYGFENEAECKLFFIAKYRYNGMINFLKETQEISCNPMLKKYLLVCKAVEHLKEDFKKKVKDILLEHADNFEKVSNQTDKSSNPQQSDDNFGKGIVTQPTDDPENKNANDGVRFFPRDIEEPVQCLPAYSVDGKETEENINKKEKSLKEKQLASEYNSVSHNKDKAVQSDHVSDSVDGQIYTAAHNRPSFASTVGPETAVLMSNCDSITINIPCTLPTNNFDIVPESDVDTSLPNDLAHDTGGRLRGISDASCEENNQYPTTDTLENNKTNVYIANKKTTGKKIINIEANNSATSDKVMKTEKTNPDKSKRKQETVNHQVATVRPFVKDGTSVHKYGGTVNTGPFSESKISKSQSEETQVKTPVGTLEGTINIYGKECQISDLEKAASSGVRTRKKEDGLSESHSLTLEGSGLDPNSLFSDTSTDQTKYSTQAADSQTSDEMQTREQTSSSLLGVIGNFLTSFSKGKSNSDGQKGQIHDV